MDSEILAWVQERIARLLPDNWSARPVLDAPGRADLTVEVRAPDGSTGRLVIEAKSVAEPNQARAVIEQLRVYAGSAVLAAPFLSKRTRDILDKAAVGYLDMTGNAFIRMDRPALYLRMSGDEKNPWSAGRRGRTLRGPKAARIVRLLCDTVRTLGVSQIATETQTDSGYVSRVLDVLERESLIERVPRGPVQRVAWEGLIRRWVSDYKVMRSNSPLSYLDPRDLGRLPGRFEGATLRYAITGSYAALFATQIAAPRLLMAYVDDPASVAAALSLRPAATGANVLLLRPFDAVVYERSVRRDGVRYVAPSQLAADLLTGPGRMPEEADELLAWMSAHEPSWRD